MTTGESVKNLNDVRALVIDDEEPIRRMITTALGRSGCHVETAGDGREGLQALLGQDFDVLVVDLKMKRMDGITFLKEARRIWPWLGVVIITGYADDASLAEANNLGITRILRKPLSLAELKTNVLGEALEKRKRVILSTNATPDHVQHQLRQLRELTDSAIASESLVEALRKLSKGLAKSLPCAVAGVLGLEENEELLLLTAQEAVSPAFLSAIQDEMCRRYEVLGGQPVDISKLHVEIDGIEAIPGGPQRLGSTLSVPVMSGGECHGVLTLAAVSDNAYDASDISFFYHAAYHLSSLFAALSRMRQLAIRDSLTGLYNRRHLEEELGRAWLLSQRYDHSMCVVIMDIDEFKTVNDTYGHLVADQALREFTQVLQHVARSTDIIARYGGDEFVVVLPQADRAEALRFCERLLTEVRERVFCPHMNPLRLTLSIGVSDNLNPLPPNSTEDFLVQADRALYTAKKQGRNQVFIWGDDPARKPDPTGSARPANPMSQRETETERPRILVVDDMPAILSLLKQLLELEGYDVTTASSVSQAIDVLTESKGDIPIVITDLNMPEKDGLDLLRELEEADKAIIKIVISGNATADNAIACLRHGAYDFVEKPIHHDQLVAVVSRALEYHRLLKENERYKNYLEEMVEQKSAALAEALSEVKNSYDFTLEALVAMLDARESNTGQHSIRVRDIAVILAQQMGLSRKQVDDIAHGALLHDIGKIAIPDAILLKPSPLSEREWEVMRTHPEIGCRILSSSPYLDSATEIVLSHQEKYDGTGYPRGLKGPDICLGARIFAIGDAYDAMRSDRVYRQAIPPEEAVEEILRGRGTHFDPDVVDAFIACQSRIEKEIGWTRCDPPVAAGVGNA